MPRLAHSGAGAQQRIRRRALAALPLLALLSACSGTLPASVYPGEEVTVGDDVFTIQPQGNDRYTLLNFATGLHNQDRLYQNAQIAAQQFSGCPVDTITKDPARNVYDIRVDCS